MKIKLIKKSYQEVMAIPEEKHRPPKKPNWFFRTLLKLVSLPDLWATGFRCHKVGMERLEKREPCLYLMNHSSFLDLEIVAGSLYPRPFNIVATTDSFVGKGWLMRQIGCIPTKKFVAELDLLRDIKTALHKQKTSVVMFPEAGYSFDGCAAALPDSLGKFLKRMAVPVVMIRTDGAFSRDPLYNGLQRRKVKVSAEMKYLLSAEEIGEKSPEELNRILAEEFSFDGFRWQQENQVRISEGFRADGLHRVLYRCPHCEAEGQTEGLGTRWSCKACGKTYELDEYGYLRAEDGDGAFHHVPDWFRWERACVRRELEEGEYRFESSVRICMAVDTKHIYEVGRGVLIHTAEGFRLVGCDGELEYAQSPKASHSICADFNFYEIGDVICLGNREALYYCFPEEDVPVAKVRLAAEELYRMMMR